MPSYNDNSLENIVNFMLQNDKKANESNNMTYTHN